MCFILTSCKSLSKIEKAIPFYTESFDILVALASRMLKPAKRMLEIGVGTGNLTIKLLNAFPDASILGMDIVGDYILQARKKLGIHKNRVDLILKDINSFDFTESYDLIVSSYGFHHIENAAQSTIYRTIQERIFSFNLFRLYSYFTFPSLMSLSMIFLSFLGSSPVKKPSPG